MECNECGKQFKTSKPESHQKGRPEGVLCPTCSTRKNASCHETIKSLEKNPEVRNPYAVEKAMEKKNSFKQFNCPDCGPCDAFPDECQCPKCIAWARGKQNDLDAGSHGHEYPGTMEGAFPVVRCNSKETVATHEGGSTWRCEECGDIISAPPAAATL